MGRYGMAQQGTGWQTGMTSDGMVREGNGVVSHVWHAMDCMGEG